MIIEVDIINGTDEVSFEMSEALIKISDNLEEKYGKHIFKVDTAKDEDSDAVYYRIECEELTMEELQQKNKTIQERMNYLNEKHIYLNEVIAGYIKDNRILQETLERCLDDANKGDWRSKGHVCEATKRCEAIVQRIKALEV